MIYIEVEAANSGVDVDDVDGVDEVERVDRRWCVDAVKAPAMGSSRCRDKDHKQKQRRS